MSRDLHRRPRRSVPAVAAAVVLLVLALAVLVSAAAYLATGEWPGPVEVALSRLEGPAWSSSLGWGVGVGLAGLGLVLVIAALTPGRMRTVRMAVDDPPVHLRAGTAYLTKAGLARLAARRLADLDGVDRATVSMPGRRLRARVTTSLADKASLRGSVRSAVGTRLADCGVSPVPKMSVRIVRRGTRP